VPLKCTNGLSIGSCRLICDSTKFSRFIVSVIIDGRNAATSARRAHTPRVDCWPAKRLPLNRGRLTRLLEVRNPAKGMSKTDIRCRAGSSATPDSCGRYSKSAPEWRPGRRPRRANGTNTAPANSPRFSGICFDRSAASGDWATSGSRRSDPVFVAVGGHLVGIVHPVPLPSVTSAKFSD
jgi:hypothetical protein